MGNAPAKLNAKAARVADLLTGGLAEPGDGRTIGKRGGGVMPVSVTRTGKNTWAISHTYEMNGDLVPDPDIEYVKDPIIGGWVPIAYQDARTYDRVAELKHTRQGAYVDTYNPRGVRDVVQTANLMLTNIAEYYPNELAELQRNSRAFTSAVGSSEPPVRDTTPREEPSMATMDPYEAEATAWYDEVLVPHVFSTTNKAIPPERAERWATLAARPMIRNMLIGVLVEAFRAHKELPRWRKGRAPWEIEAEMNAGYAPPASPQRPASPPPASPPRSARPTQPPASTQAPTDATTYTPEQAIEALREGWNLFKVARPDLFITA